MTAHAVKALRRGKFTLSTRVFIDAQMFQSVPQVKSCYTCINCGLEDGTYYCKSTGQPMGYNYKEYELMTACDQHNEKRPLYSVESDSFSDFLF